MKQKLSILLILTLLLSLFAGCTPADAPSTGDSSVDASVTDSNASDTSLSETDGVISETNIDASTDTSIDSATTDTSTNTEPANPYAALLEAKSVLTAEDIRRVFETIRLGETDRIDLKALYGKEGKLAGSGTPRWEWEFDNVTISCSINSYTSKYSNVIVELKEPIPKDRVFDFLRLLGVDPDAMDLHSKSGKSATAHHVMSDQTKHLISYHNLDASGNIENLYNLSVQTHNPAEISIAEIATICNSVLSGEASFETVQSLVAFDPKPLISEGSQFLLWRFHALDVEFHRAFANSGRIDSLSLSASNSWNETLSRDEVDELLQQLGLRRIDFKVEKDVSGRVTYRRVSADKKTEIVIRFSDDKADIFYSIQINCK